MDYATRRTSYGTWTGAIAGMYLVVVGPALVWGIVARAVERSPLSDVAAVAVLSAGCVLAWFLYRRDVIARQLRLQSQEELERRRRESERPD